MDLMQKLTLLADGAKYDAACTSSGSDRVGVKDGIGSTVMAGCCHSFSADGRCVSLLKVLYTNHCVYDCKYCVNRVSNDTKRAAFEPVELANLTIEFYRRNYIEGLFLSSGVLKNPDYTTERMIETLSILRNKYKFNGYIHAKTIPGTSSELIYKLGLLADRLSINIELPSENSLKLLAPNKTKAAILSPMRFIAEQRNESTNALAVYKHAPNFANAGQATQMIIGASPESDYQIIRLASGLYSKYSLKRVFYSAYVPVVDNSLLPAVDTKPPLLREHRLYQADWLMRKYGFAADEILSEKTPDFNPFMDPKCNWAVHNMWFFPVDVNKASEEALLRVPGIGPVSARRIVVARRLSRLDDAALKRIGVVMKRARYFITTANEPRGMRYDASSAAKALMDPKAFSHGAEQISMFGYAGLTKPQERLLLNDVTENVSQCIKASS